MFRVVNVAISDVWKEMTGKPSVKEALEEAAIASTPDSEGNEEN